MSISLNVKDKNGAYDYKYSPSPHSGVKLSDAETYWLKVTITNCQVTFNGQSYNTEFTIAAPTDASINIFNNYAVTDTGLMFIDSNGNVVCRPDLSNIENPGPILEEWGNFSLLLNGNFVDIYSDFKFNPGDTINITHNPYWLSVIFINCPENNASFGDNNYVNTDFTIRRPTGGGFGLSDVLCGCSIDINGNVTINYDFDNKCLQVLPVSLYVNNNLVFSVTTNKLDPPIINVVKCNSGDTITMSRMTGYCPFG
jgi:hypothetical protein